MFAITKPHYNTLKIKKKKINKIKGAIIDAAKEGFIALRV
jgi:hypothetical protein